MLQAAVRYDASERAKAPFDGLHDFSKRQRLRRIFRPMAVLLDCSAICFGFLICTPSSPASAQVEQGDVVLAILFTHVLVAANMRAYSLSSLLRPVKSAQLGAVSLLMASINVMLVLTLLHRQADISGTVLIAGNVAALLSLVLVRTASANFAVRRFGISALGEIVICDGVSCTQPHGAMILDATACRLAPQLDDPDSLDRLGQHLRDADRVVVACRPERRADWAQALKGAGIRAEVFASEIEPLGPIGLGSFAGRTTLVVASGPLGLVDRSMKRLLDLAIIILTSPLTLPLALTVAIAVKMDSAGPVLFRQQRMGAGNRIFTVLKFRSMRVEYLDPTGTASTARGDHRLTRIGRFIRRTSLDELPQLINVLRGEMSVVGPRPHALGSKAEERFFWDIDSTYWHRHAVKPGITGLAQVRGLRGATRKQSDLTRRLQADLEYLSGWSVWRDLRIIIRTLGVIVHRNAY